jgi:hypothetical protein
MDLFASLFYCTLEELPVRCRVNQWWIFRVLLWELAIDSSHIITIIIMEHKVFKT